MALAPVKVSIADMEKSEQRGLSMSPQADRPRDRESHATRPRGRTALSVLTIAALLALAGCGGSSGGKSTASSVAKPAETTTTTATATTATQPAAPSTSSAAGVVTATSGTVKATLHATTHNPRVQRAWPIRFTVTSGGHAAKASVIYEYLFGGQVVARRSHYTFTGHFADIFRWPSSAVGYPLTFRAVIVAAGVTLNLDYPVQVSK
jgi:hypothetical protein